MTRRLCCVRCTRPMSACICRWVAALATRVDLLILQHPMETANAKGSARLLHLGVANSRLAEGEAFDPALLQALLHADGRVPVLLYPDTPDAPGAPLAGALLAEPAALRLVVLDGTWRKSRKMLHQNPLLQALPRLPLTQMPASHYLIRKAHAPDQLSTLEASCHALAQLDPGADVQPMLAAFDAFVAHFQATGGRLDLPAHACTVLETGRGAA
ncbi:MAG: tRNA-uridine aminocarboxypropyltransferase [Pseudomonadota bacterium]